MYKIGNEREPTDQYRELYLTHGGDLNWKEIQKGADICTHTADPFCCIVETNTQHCKATIRQ